MALAPPASGLYDFNCAASVPPARDTKKKPLAGNDGDDDDDNGNGWGLLNATFATNGDVIEYSWSKPFVPDSDATDDIRLEGELDLIWALQTNSGVGVVNDPLFDMPAVYASLEKFDFADSKYVVVDG